MEYFTKSDFVFNNVSYKRYTADRKRGGVTWVFFGEVPHDTTYDPTWPVAITNDATFSNILFVSNINADLIHVDFLSDLSITEEIALETLYANHVAPVPI